MDRLPSFWQLENFVERLDAWIATENPSEDLRIIVTEWVVARFDNPYTDVSREPEFPNLWFGPIPETEHSGQVWFVPTGSSRTNDSSGVTKSLHSGVRCEDLPTLVLAGVRVASAGYHLNNGAVGATSQSLGRAEVLAALLPSPGHSTLLQRTSLLALSGSHSAATASMYEAVRVGTGHIEPVAVLGCEALHQLMLLDLTGHADPRPAEVHRITMEMLNDVPSQVFQVQKGFGAQLFGDQSTVQEVLHRFSLSPNNCGGQYPEPYLLWAPCAANWPGKSDDRYTGPWDAKTTTPILLIGTRYDPNTSCRNAVRSQLLLGDAVLLTHDGYGHLSFKDPSACIEKARTAYLVDLQLPAPGTVCAADQPPFNV